MSISDFNMGADLEGLVVQFAPTAFDESLIKTEACMQKMTSSPFIEALNRHEALVSSIAVSPVLETIQKQQDLLSNLPSQSVLESAAKSINGLSEALVKAVDFQVPQYICLAESLSKAVDSYKPQLALIGGAVQSFVNSIPKIDPAYIEMANNALNNVNSFVATFARRLSTVAGTIRGIDFSPLYDISINLSHIADFEEKSDTLKEFGWYLISGLPEDIIDEIYERRIEISQAEVDALIVGYFRNNKCQALKAIVNNWAVLPYFESRRDVFHEAQVCHSRRSFIASTTLISLHLEGVITDFVRLRMTPRRHVKDAMRDITECTYELTIHDMPFTDWLACSYILECLDALFKEQFSPADPESAPNTSRHKIAHGHATAKETEANSLRRFLFMNELYKLFCCLEKQCVFVA